MPRNTICWPGMEPEKTFDQKMKEGSRTMDGISESMPLREPHERPWSKQVHAHTRSDHEPNS
jgi:hypothetical protein